MTKDCTFLSSVSLFALLISFLLCSVGDSAKNAFHSNPENTVFDAKRLIGRKMDDQDIVRDIKHWPFHVSEKNGKPTITVKHKGDDRDFVSRTFLPTPGCR
jgi:molecular chaperone DnaK (HSP70)